jgi:putative methanogenesis marker 16 metalloprotein
VEATSNEGREVEAHLCIDDMSTAKLLSSRNCFRNYRAYVNPSDREFTSIFHCRPFPPDYAGLTFSGCGHLNPLQNDPQLRGIGIGTKLLFNGAEGYIVSNGTRSSVKYPNLMTVAEMKGMDPKLMGGYLTAAGVECLTSYAVPIPIVDRMILEHVMTMDADIPLSIGDIRDRRKIGQADYGQVWSDRDEVIAMDEERCVGCEECPAASICPTFAIVRDGSRMSIDRDRCINCGVCVSACPEDCFSGRLGDVRATIDGEERIMPILCRNSNREGAVRTMDDLKKRIVEGTFTITAKVADLRP